MNTQVAAKLQKVSKEPQWLTDVHTAARAAFEEMDWPRPDQEEWRRTNLEGFPFDQYTFAPERLTNQSPLVGVAEQGGFFLRYPLNGTGGEMSSESLAAVRAALELSSSELDNRFLAWNLTAWSDAVFLHVPDGVVLDEPVLVEYLNPENGTLLQTHTVVVLGREARATVLQRHAGGGDCLWNGGLTAVVGDGARLYLSGRQEVSDEASFFHHSKIHLGRDATFNGFEALTGGRLTKVRTEVYIEGPGAEADLQGIYFSRARQHMDIKTVQYHREPHGTSRAFYKGAVAEGGRSIYQGLIDVERKAEGTDAYLTNKNLILSDGARADSIPCLEIRTNDVKCSHGSTSGRINEAELFYLMSRGIRREDAERCLIVGYFDELIQKAPEMERDAIRSRIETLVG